MSPSIEWKLLQQVLEEVRELREEVRAQQRPKELPTFLSLTQAAEELSMSTRQLRRLVRSGQILPVHAGTTPKIAASELRRIATRFPSMQSPGSKMAPRPKFPTKGYSPDHERKKLAELRKKRGR